MPDSTARTILGKSRNEYMRNYMRNYKLSPEQKERRSNYNKAYNKEYEQRPEIKEKRKAYMQAYYQDDKNKKRSRDMTLRREYGITLEDFDALLLNQGGVCAICGTAEWGGHGPVVDHCHKIGTVRGILCSFCNTAAGLLGDNPDRAIRLASYLGRGK